MSTLETVEVAVVVIVVMIVLYCGWRRFTRPRHNGFAIPVRDVDAKKRFEKVEERLLELQRDLEEQIFEEEKAGEDQGQDEEGGEGDADVDSRN